MLCEQGSEPSSRSPARPLTPPSRGTIPSTPAVSEKTWRNGSFGSFAIEAQVLTVNPVRKISAGISTFKSLTRLTPLSSDTVQALSKVAREHGSDGSSGIAVSWAPCWELASAESTPPHHRLCIRFFLHLLKFGTFDGTFAVTSPKAVRSAARLRPDPLFC
jgi:hypothetical protein